MSQIFLHQSLLDFFGNWAHEMYFILYSTCRCSRNHNFASIAHSYFTLLHEKPCRNDTSLFFRYYTKVHFLLDFTVFIKSLFVFLKQKIMLRQKIMIFVYFIFCILQVILRCWCGFRPNTVSFLSYFSSDSS